MVNMERGAASPPKAGFINRFHLNGTPEGTLGVGRSLRARPECFRESLALGGACEPVSRLAQGGGYIQGAVRAETARASAERVDTQVGMRRKRRSGSRARVR